MPRYTKRQIEEYVRVRQLALRQQLIPLDREMRALSHKRREITDELHRLDSAEGLVEGMDTRETIEV